LLLIVKQHFSAMLFPSSTITDPNIVSSTKDQLKQSAIRSTDSSANISYPQH
jgi:hypothetical protein